MKSFRSIRSLFKNVARSRRALIIASGLLVLATLAATPVRGQQLNCRPWGDIPEYKGTVTVSSQMSGTNQSGETRKVNESVTYAFDATYPVSACSAVVTWVGLTATLTYSIDDITTDPCGPGQAPSKQEVKAEGPPLTGTDPNAGYFNIAFQGGSGDLQPNSYTVQVPQFLPGKVTVTDCNGNQVTSDVLAHYGPNVPQSRFVLNIPLPTATAPLQTLASNGPQTVSDIPDPLGVPLSWNVSWTITPVQNFDVQVKIPAYATWRPTGGALETDIGTGSDGLPNALEIDAEIVDKTTQLPIPAAMDKTTFTLTEVSREPGVTMNWPALGAAKSAPDMSFDAQQNPAIFGYTPSPSPDGTSLVFDPTETGTRASGTAALLSPHDWGGWATLNVTITVAGTDYPGHLQPPPNLVANDSPDILLPARQANSHIADSWKAAHGVLGRPDGDDSEVNLGNNSSYAGDGLTLYEEYRGFYVPCVSAGLAIGTCVNGQRHVEGDPNKKDLFVINETLDPDIERGIKQFAQRAGINWCCPTLNRGYVTQDRIINFNVGQGAHNVAQHAVVIGFQAAGRVDGCTSTTTLMSGTPAVVNKIYIPHVADLTDVSEIARALKKLDVQNVDPTKEQVNMVAHELGHAASIWHHGDEGPDIVWWYSPDGQKIREVGKGASNQLAKQFRDRDIGNDIQVFLEDGTSGGTPVSAAQLGLAGPDPATNSPANLVGLHQGQGPAGGHHSGDVFCFMRYDASVNYVANKNSSWRYLARESMGLGLTNKVQGTGTNGNGHHPQSRYGDSLTNRGDCLTQFCINDHITPTPRGGPAPADCAPPSQ